MSDVRLEVGDLGLTGFVDLPRRGGHVGQRQVLGLECGRDLGTVGDELGQRLGFGGGVHDSQRY